MGIMCVSIIILMMTHGFKARGNSDSCGIFVSSTPNRFAAVKRNFLMDSPDKTFIKGKNPHDEVSQCSILADLCLITKSVAFKHLNFRAKTCLLSYCKYEQILTFAPTFSHKLYCKCR